MAADRESWQVDESAAELYERYLVPAVTLPWAEDLVERVGLARGDHVLDVACGTGVVARVAAARVGAAGRVVGVDVNTGMLDVARTTPSVSDSASIEWVEGSAQTLPFADGEFGVVVCQLGLQFFEDRRSALKELHRVLIPAGRIGASVYTSIDRNPAAFVLADVVDRHFGDDASRAKRSEHSLADPQELRDLFEAAGFGDVRIDTVTQIVRFRSVDEWVEIQLTATPLAALLADRDPAERERLVGAVRADVREGMADFASDNAFAFPQEVHVAVGSGYAAS